MNIFVCVKQVPDTETKIIPTADGSFIETNSIKWIMNPYDEYAVEQEIRVLYINKASNTSEPKWILTNSHSILNPLISIKYDKLPFEITKVLFGSRAPEADVNIRQFKYLSEENGMSLTFDKSRINNYR